jgi:endonuclease YncB( thermonuclease family)
MKKYIIAFSTFLLLLAIVFAVKSCKEVSNSPTETKFSNPFIDDSCFVKVYRVVDGDTFEFIIERDTVDVRILELDCFESRRGTRLDEQAAAVGIDPEVALLIGQAAKKFANDYLINKNVKLVRDRKETNIDSFGRLLRKVYVDNKRFRDTMCAQAFTVECYR